MNFNFDSLMDTISNLRERGAEYANVAMDKTKDAARLAKLTVSLTGERRTLSSAKRTTKSITTMPRACMRSSLRKWTRSTRASKRCRRRSTRSRARST